MDARRFEAFVVSATRATRPEERIELLEKGLELWRGDPYPELADVTDVTERTRLSEIRGSAVEDLMQARLDLGEHDGLVGELEALVSEHPLRERLWGQLMVALYRSGRQSEALQAYQRLRRKLVEELGIDPSEEIQELERRILLHDRGLSLSTTSTGGNNLRPALTSFIGRTAELREVSDLLSSTRITTLIGPAGSGKTRLACEVAAGLVDDFTDGVWFVDLAPLTSPDQVADAIAAPLGVGGQTGRPTEAILRDYLPGRRLLLIIDNCEHLVARVAHLATDLLQADLDLTVLATSRERLGIPGEVLYEVPPLACPDDDEDIEDFDAVLLFLERARDADPHFELDPPNRASVAEICRRLDGIPLTLELAAARVRSLPPVELRRHLDQRFTLFTSPVRTELARHQTLQAALDWSYQLLDQREQALFRRLSVFRGGFRPEAAAQICGFEPLDHAQALHLLPELIDKSLVVVDYDPVTARTRYFLWETLREYGQERLDAREAGALRDRHAARFRDLAEEAAAHLRGPQQQAWLRVLADDHDNLRKSLRWSSTTDPETAVRTAIALTDYWDSVGPRAEGHEWLQRAVTLSDMLGSELRIGTRLAASDLFSSAHASVPIQYAEEALAEALRVGDVAGEARALRALSYASTLGERSDEGAELGRRALRIFEGLDDPWETALCLERLGQADYQEPARSMAHLERSLSLYRQVGDRKREALALSKLAERLAQGTGDTMKAAGYAEEAVAICDEMGSLNDHAHALLEYGKILRRLGEPERAVGTLEKALGQLSKSGDERCSVRTLTALGTAHLDRAETDAAIGAFRSSLQRLPGIDDRNIGRVAIAGMARILSSRGKLADAVTLYAFADTIQDELRVPVSAPSRRSRKERIEALRSEMRLEQFEHARELGKAMNLDDAVAFALGASMEV